MAARAVLIGLLAVAPLLASPGLAVVATDLDDDRVVVCRGVRAGERLVLAFTHSMYGGVVREEYAAMGNAEFRRVAVTTANAAAAEYYAYTAAVIREGDRFRLDVPEASFRRIVVRADGIGRHRLEVGGSVVPLLAEGGEGRPVRLELVERPLWAGWRGGAC